MNKLWRVTLFLMFLCTGVLHAQTPAQLTDPNYNPGLIEHIVLFRFKPDVTIDKKEAVIDSFMSLRLKCVRNGAPYILLIENGFINNKGLGSHHEFELGFVVKFQSEGDRNFYVGKPFITDPQFFDAAHERFKNFVGDFLLPGDCGPDTFNGAFVFDFKDKQLPPEDTVVTPVNDTITLATCGRTYKYLPLKSPSGRTWLDRNMGAEDRATRSDDNWAWGSLYQWGRGNDGHQCVNWKSGQPPTSGTIATLSAGDVPGHGLFIIFDNLRRDWRITRNDNLWQGVNGINNPCPAGYRVPTSAEWQAEIPYISGANGPMAVLALPAPFLRERNGTFYQFPSGTSYWSSTATEYVNNTLAASTLSAFTNGGGSIQTGYRQQACPVRCIKN